MAICTSVPLAEVKIDLKASKTFTEKTARPTQSLPATQVGVATRRRPRVQPQRWGEIQEMISRVQQLEDFVMKLNDKLNYIAKAPFVPVPAICWDNIKPFLNGVAANKQYEQWYRYCNERT